MKTKKKPNIIIFNPDEMRLDAMGHMGNAAAFTPNLDWFAESEAVSFSNAYCQNPVCVPSRCSFTTGLYPHVNGHRTMSYLMHEHETSMFKELKDAGYYVWLNSRNDLVAGQISGLAESHADEVFYYDKKTPLIQLPLSILGGGNMEKNTHPYSHFTGVTERETGEDSRDVKAAIDRIMNPVSDKPLCLFIGLNNPHPPYAVERKYYDKIDKNRMPERAKDEDTIGKSLMMEEIRKYSGMEDYSEEQWSEMRAVYYGQCSMVDEMFGQIISALKMAGEYDNSAIFVLSDHGDFAGDYNLPEKAQNTFENCLTKVPFLVKPPKWEKVDPGISDGVVELVDFYATVLDYAHVSATHDHFGISLRPMIEDRAKIVRKYAFSEGGRLFYEEQCDEFHANGMSETQKTNEYWARMMAQCNDLAHEKGTMITDGKYKYIERLSGRNEFYNLLEDPKELHNLYEQEKESLVVLEMKKEMLKWYQATCDIVPREYDSRFTEEKIWAILRNFCSDEKEKQMRKYIRNGATLQQCIAYLFQLNC